MEPVPITPELIEKFNSHVTPLGPDDCWNWKTNRIGKYGKFCYGSITFVTSTGMMTVGAHRLAFILHHGRQITDGMQILHSCNNPKCVNPNHLREGTQLDNNLQKIREGRMVKNYKKRI